MNTDYLVTDDITKIRENGATSGIGVLATYGYDNLGNRTSVTFGNGTSSAFSYDPVSRLASLTNDLAGTSNDLTINGIAYNPASQITALTRSNDAYAWTGHGNGSTATVTNGLNELSTVGGVSAAHDAKGNLTTDPTNAKTYGYSSENLLTSASGGATLAYDPLLRLYQVASGVTTRFAYDGLDAIAEYDGSNVLQKRYVFGAGTDEPIVQYDGAGIRSWLTADERGSIIAIADDSGTVTATNSYDEYGKPAAANTGRFQYTGQMWLPELGLYYYKARFYAPHLGRFMQTDPVGYADSPNLYNYVLGDPVNLVDPLGEDACAPTDVCVTGSLPAFGHPGVMVGASGTGGGSRLGPPCTTCIMVIGQHPKYPAAPEDELLPSDCTICNATVTGNLIVGLVITAKRNAFGQQSEKWVLSNGRYELNPLYTSPWYDIGLDGFLKFQLAGYALAASPVVADFLFAGQRVGILNNNRYFRVGWGPGKGATEGNYWESFRFVIGKGKKAPHFDVWPR